MNSPKNYIRSTCILAAAILPGIAFLCIPRIMLHYPDLSEAYALHIFPWISKPGIFINSLFPVSLSEIFVVFMALSGIIWLIWLFLRLYRSKNRKHFLYRTFLIAGIVFSVASASFTFMHGINYTRQPLTHSLSLHPAKRDAADLIEVSAWLAGEMTDSRSQLPEDKNGCMMLQTTISQALDDAQFQMDRAAKVFPVLAGNGVRAKPVALSHAWSYTGITGMYFPFFNEANVNIDIPAMDLPMKICHEISHTRGIAREQDANLAAFLACISSDRPDFAYSGYEFAFLYCSSDLADADRDAYNKIIQKIPDGVYRDWLQENAYWAQFEGPVEQTSTTVNDSYLKANQQEAGVKSYSLVTDLIIDYYFTYVKGQ